MSGTCHVKTAANLRRWAESGQPQAWVEAHAGQWNHEEWLALLQRLQTSKFWPLEPDAVGLVLEDLKRQRANLQRWWESGEPRHWVESHQGAWDHDDWLDLIGTLQQSAYGPLQPAAVGRMLEEIKTQYWTLRRWEASGQPRAWVDDRQGAWDHTDWLELVETLEQSEYWPIDLNAVGELVENMKAERANLQRWRQSDEPRQWVESRQGTWAHGDWLALLETLRQSEYWPMQRDAVGAVLEEQKGEQCRLQVEEMERPPLRCAEAEVDPFGEADWLSLLHRLTQLEVLPMVETAVLPIGWAA